MDSTRDVTQMLKDWRSPNQTLQTAALVHEAYMRLVDRQALDWQNRAHFFGVAAKMMRGILVNYSIANSAEKRGGGNVKLSLDEAVGTPGDTGNQEFDILALNDALKKLEAADERKSRIVELRFFAGLGNEEIAEALGISVPTVKREWKLTKAWLRYEMGRSASLDESRDEE